MSNSKYKKPTIKVHYLTNLYKILKELNCPVTYNKYHHKLYRKQDIEHIKKVVSIVIGDKKKADSFLDHDEYFFVNNETFLLIIKILKMNKDKRETVLNEIILKRL